MPTYKEGDWVEVGAYSTFGEGVSWLTMQVNFQARGIGDTSACCLLNLNVVLHRLPRLQLGIEAIAEIDFVEIIPNC